MKRELNFFRCTSNRRLAFFASHGVVAAIALILGQSNAAGEPPQAVGWDPYITFSGNADAGFRKTQFFENDHNAAVGSWDSRLEFWMPPYRTEFSWGPYIRFAGIAASRSQPWENELSGGAGGQVYPFSLESIRESGVAKILGPLRVFGEYNRVDFWGKGNEWRPREQQRYGAEYWREWHVNEDKPCWWVEFWSGGWWQSANEFDSHYNSWVFANSLRAGIRKPESGLLSSITPYALIESSLTDNPAYYWENRLSLGGGLRFAPAYKSWPKGLKWLNRFVLYAEYAHEVAYYRQTAPSPIPIYDFRAGASFSIGEWYH